MSKPSFFEKVIYPSADLEKRIVAPESAFAFIWGEGAPESPYDRDRYHLGQLTTACAMSQLLETGHQVTVLFTSDNHPRRTGAVAISEQLYKHRCDTLKTWLISITGKFSAQLVFCDLAEEYDQIVPKARNVSSFWWEAYDAISPIITRLDNAFKEATQPDREHYKVVLTGVLATDSFISALTGAPACIIKEAEAVFSKIQYAEKQEDVGAFLYMLFGKDKKWQNMIRDQWLVKCGTFLSYSMHAKVILESCRNAFWIRALRLIYNLTRTVSKTNSATTILFPIIAFFSNLPNTQNKGPMKGTSRDSAAFISEDTKQLFAKIQKSSTDFIKQTFVRLAWGSGSFEEFRQLLEFSDVNVANRRQAEIALLEAISVAAHAWKEEDTATIQLDDWFCVRYVSEAVIGLAASDRWKKEISCVVRKDICEDNMSYRRLAVSMANTLFPRSQNPAFKLAIPVFEKILGASGQIDTVLYMTKKRYRDHGRHQVNVAILGHLLMNALSKGSTYKSNQTPAQVVADSLGISLDDVNAMFFATAISHDHGYPLIEIAWLFSSLYTMDPRVSAEERKRADMLATALLSYISSFASQWFHNLLNCVKDSGAMSLRIANWEPEQRDLVATLLNIAPGDLSKHIQWPSHGLLSAVNLLQLIKELGTCTNRDPNIIAIARAIAIHDLSYANMPLYKVPFETTPFGYFLVLADELQEWGRPIIWEGEPVYESAKVLVGGLIDIGRHIWKYSKNVNFRFHHLGVAHTGVPWDYNTFRLGKAVALDRLSCSTDLLPDKYSFDMTVGN